MLQYSGLTEPYDNGYEETSVRLALQDNIVPPTPRKRRDLVDWDWLLMYKRGVNQSPQIYGKIYRNYIKWYSDNKCV